VHMCVLMLLNGWVVPRWGIIGPDWYRMWCDFDRSWMCGDYMDKYLLTDIH
jgi:hypothetical protein